MTKISVDNAIQKAKKHAKIGEIEAAQKLYEGILRVFPKNKRAQKGLALLKIEKRKTLTQTPSLEKIRNLFDLHKQGESNKLVYRAQLFLKEHPDAVEVWNLIGIAHMDLGNVKQAEQAFLKVTNLNPNDANGFNNLGATLQKQGNLDEAIEAYKKAISLEPNFPEVYHNMGIVFQAKNQQNESSWAYKKALSLKPDNAETHNNLGIIFKAQGRFDDAIQAFNKAIYFKPNYAEAHNNLGTVLGDQGNQLDAILSYEKAISLRPNYAEPYYNVGVILQDQNKPKDAIEAYKKALENNPNYAEAFFNMGISLYEQDKTTESIAAFNNAISLKSDYAEAYFNKGNILQKLGDFDDAIKAYKEALLIQPEHAATYNNMANALRKESKLEEAEVFAHKAISLKPKYSEAYNNLGNILNDRGRLKEAVTATNTALAINPQYAEAHNTLGNSFKNQGELKKAINSYKDAISLKPDYAEAHVNLSFALLNFGKWGPGLDEYEWRLRHPDFLPSQRHYPRPLWNGETNLEGKTILVWGEQGPQDMIIWSSSLRKLSVMSNRVILECPKKLVPLFARSFPDIQVREYTQHATDGSIDFDYHLPMGSLFRHLIPHAIQKGTCPTFLKPDPNKVEKWQKRLNFLESGPYVGISWKSPLITPERINNYTQMSDWKPVFQNHRLTFINLQATDYANDIIHAEEKLNIKIHNFDELDHYNDLDEVAALTAAIDVCVSVSTAVAAIAAGVGTKTNLISWRQSSWNNQLLAPLGPNVKKFQCDTWDNWSTVFNNISEDLNSLERRI